MITRTCGDTGTIICMFENDEDNDNDGDDDDNDDDDDDDNDDDDDDIAHGELLCVVWSSGKEKPDDHLMIKMVMLTVIYI